MAKLVKGAWSVCLLRSDHDPERPCIGINFALLRSDLPSVHPLAAQTILHAAAAELSGSLAISCTDVPVRISVDETFAADGDRMIGTIRIQWHIGNVRRDQDGQYVERFIAIASDFLLHLQEEPFHNVLICTDTEQEAERLHMDPEVNRIVCARPQLPDLGSAPKPEPEVNSPPARGVN